MNNRKGPTSSTKVLKNGVVLLQSAYKEFYNTNIIFSWRIFHYSKLRKYVLYYQLFENEELKCVFKIFKTNKALHVCLRNEKIKNQTAKFFIANVHNGLLLTETQKTEGLFIGFFENRLFLEDNNFLKNDILTVSFIYEGDSQTFLQQTSLQDPDIIADQDELCNDLKHMYLASLHTDFTIHVGNHTFKAHRFVLATRSKFFNKFFSKNATKKEYTLDSVPRILHEVLLYLYSGELRKLDLPSMLEMFDVAHKLKIDTLIKKCLEFVHKNINEFNHQLISALAEQLNSRDLRKIVVDYLS